MKKLLVGLTLFIGLLQITSRATAQVIFGPPSGAIVQSEVGFSFETLAGLSVGQPTVIIDGRGAGFPLSYTGISGGYNTYSTTVLNFSQFGAHTFTWTFNGVTYGPYPFYVEYPVPGISALSQLSAAPGSSTIGVTVTGSDFTPQSQVNWNNWILPVRYVSATKLTATIDSRLLASATTANVTVSNPAPGGGTGQGASFTVGHPAPTLAALNPNSATAGSADITLTATGSNFNTQSAVLWNGSPLATTYLSPQQVTATVPAAKLAATGTATVAVSNSASGGGTTASKTFAINNPVPTLSSISPTSATHGSAAITLTASGTNFNTRSTILWNGTALTTTYVSATQLKASVSAANLTTVGTATVTVFNPTPGGGTSTAVTFTIN
ncbi:MAG: cell surface receptor domain protein [Chthonomonadaceae bacterium]|nr:cell surface receptor domain protein [Chthonomonadaceae bacterium]